MATKCIARTSLRPRSSIRDALRIFFLRDASRDNAMRCDDMTITQSDETSASAPEPTYMNLIVLCRMVYRSMTSSTLSSDSPPRKLIDEPANSVACVAILLRISMRWSMRSVSTSIIALAFAMDADSVWAVSSCCCASCMVGGRLCPI